MTFPNRTVEKVYTSSAPTTQRIGMPTQRRQSSISARTEMTAKTTIFGSFVTRVAIMMILLAFAAK